MSECVRVCMCMYKYDYNILPYMQWIVEFYFWDSLYAVWNIIQIVIIKSNDKFSVCLPLQGPLIPAAFTNGYHWEGFNFMTQVK